MAKLYFRYGAMGSGKSALLLQAAYNYEAQGMKVFIMKPIIDSKADDCIISRIGIKRKVDYLVKEADNLFEYFKNIDSDIQCIFVDEVQFLNPIQVDQLMQVVTILEIPVICYGLRTDFKTKGFPAASRLLEIAHTIEEIKTICKCGKKAMFNARRVNGKFLFAGDQIAIDEKNNVTYEALCPKCYYHKLEQYEKIKSNLK